MEYESFHSIKGDSSNITRIRSGVWALNADSIRIGLYLSSFVNGDTALPITSCAKYDYRWIIESEWLIIKDKSGLETYYLKN